MQVVKVRPVAKLTAVLFITVISCRTMLASAPPTLVEALRSWGVSQAVPDLVEALKDPRPYVRAAASAELSELKAVAALPAILEAAAIEKQDLVQAEMFESALALGSSQVIEPLAALCTNAARSGQARLVAARALFRSGDHRCFAAVADMMLPLQTPGDRIQAWYLLAQLTDRTDQETRLVLGRLLPALSEQDPYLRLEASTGLRLLHDPSAAEPLRTAILNESDKVVRDRMLNDLASLTATR
jgi:HEAT repeat protein